MEPIPFLSRSILKSQRIIGKDGEEHEVREVGVVLTLDDGTNEFYSEDQRVLVVPQPATEEGIEPLVPSEDPGENPHT